MIGKFPRWVQNIIFVIIVIIGSGGIFYRHGLSLGKGFTPKTLLVQMLQVCNFNFILLPLCLVPKFKLARQYAFYFSMFAASTTFISYSSSLAKLNWNDITVMNFWLNHLAAVALPLFMLASGRFKPEKKYIPMVTIAMVVYFLIAWLGNYYLITYEGYRIEDTFSFIYNTYKNPLLETLYKLIPMPFVYMLPLLPIVVGWFYLIEFIVNKIINKKKRLTLN